MLRNEQGVGCIHTCKNVSIEYLHFIKNHQSSDWKIYSIPTCHILPVYLNTRGQILAPTVQFGNVTVGTRLVNMTSSAHKRVFEGMPMRSHTNLMLLSTQETWVSEKKGLLAGRL